MEDAKLVYGLLGVERDRGRWISYGMRRYSSFAREEVEQIFQDCMLHCWLMYDELSYSEWKSEFRQHLYQEWSKLLGRILKHRLMVELDASVSDDGEDERILGDILPDKVLSVELQVICREEAPRFGNRFWDEYEKLSKNKYHEEHYISRDKQNGEKKRPRQWGKVFQVSFKD